jgi:hypothetical protein
LQQAAVLYQGDFVEHLTLGNDSSVSRSDLHVYRRHDIILIDMRE